MVQPGLFEPISIRDMTLKNAGVMTMAVGVIVHADQAEQILQEGRADRIALARELP